MHTCGTYMYVMYHMCMCTHTRYMKVRITCATVKIPVGLLNSPRLYLQIFHVYRYTGIPVVLTVATG
jgi:hypothetical protein